MEDPDNLNKEIKNAIN